MINKKKPKDYTEYAVGAGQHVEWVKVYYKDYSKYEFLPDVVKDMFTALEYAAYWDWAEGKDD